MNNAFKVEEQQDKVPDTSTEEARLTRLIEAIAGLIQTREYAVLQELHFSTEEKRIERLLIAESKKTVINQNELYRLQGEMKWATRYADMNKWAQLLTYQRSKLKHHE
jgi:hypothetical protein